MDSDCSAPTKKIEKRITLIHRRQSSARQRRPEAPATARASALPAPLPASIGSRRLWICRTPAQAVSWPAEPPPAAPSRKSPVQGAQHIGRSNRRSPPLPASVHPRSPLPRPSATCSASGFRVFRRPLFARLPVIDSLSEVRWCVCVLCLCACQPTAGCTTSGRRPPASGQSSWRNG